MLLLGLDTATPAVTVALHDGGQPLAQLVTVDAHRHAELLAPAIAKVIADAGATPRDLTGIAVGVGPGPYTGLRVGVVTAKVLGLALGLPVYGVCSLDVIAADVEGERSFVVATDARRREVFWARYDETGRWTGPAVDRPADLQAQFNVHDLPVAGEGPLLYPEHFPHGRGPTFPAAATLCRIVAAALARGETVTDPAAAATTATAAATASTAAGSTATPSTAANGAISSTAANAAAAGEPGSLPVPGAEAGTAAEGGPVGGTGTPLKRRPLLVPPEPLYLRRPDAREPGAPKRVTP